LIPVNQPPSLFLESGREIVAVHTEHVIQRNISLWYGDIGVPLLNKHRNLQGLSVLRPGARLLTERDVAYP